MRISIEFSDASFTTGDLELVSSGALILYTDPYITTAGAKIPNKVWRLEYVRDNIWRVTGKNVKDSDEQSKLI